MKNNTFRLVIATALLAGCNTDKPNSGADTVGDTGSSAGFNYEDVELPDHFAVAATGGMGGPSALDMDNTPEDNPITNDGANLGRHLLDIAASRGRRAA